jgi:hypothetical protein
MDVNPVAVTTVGKRVDDAMLDAGSDRLRILFDSAVRRPAEKCDPNRASDD